MKPNIFLILNDDMGYSDIGCYGGEVQTPNLDRLAAGGLRFTQFYNTARCCPSRASLLTGLHPHQAGIGWMSRDLEYESYRGDLSTRSVTIAEVLKTAGYATYMSGKWHVTAHNKADGPKHSWPRQRGFDRYFGITSGGAHYWNPDTLTVENTRVSVDEYPSDFFLTDAISDQAAEYVRRHAEAEPDRPFFLYTAYTAPHFPLHAPESDIEKYRGRFAAGWDRLREERINRMREMGILDSSWPLSPRDASQPPWEEAENKEWQQRRMEVYAAQIDRMDQGIGRIIKALEETGKLDNTLIMFLSDNGGCAEEITSKKASHTRDGREAARGNNPAVMPGPDDTYQSYGVAWANLSNTPFRRYKHWVHEGGIATPLIMHWPDRIGDARSGARSGKGAVRSQPGQLPDIMATCVEAAGAEYPESYNGNSIIPLEGTSLIPAFDNIDNGKDYLFWEHEGNSAVRNGKWKLVRRFPHEWELYDIEADRTELNDLARDNPGVVAELADAYENWADRCGVQPWEKIIAVRGKGRQPVEIPPEEANEGK